MQFPNIGANAVTMEDRTMDGGGQQEINHHTIYYLWQELNPPNLPHKQGGSSQILHDILL